MKSNVVSPHDFLNSKEECRYKIVWEKKRNKKTLTRARLSSVTYTFLFPAVLFWGPSEVSTSTNFE